MVGVPNIFVKEVVEALEEFDKALVLLVGLGVGDSVGATVITLVGVGVYVETLVGLAVGAGVVSFTEHPERMNNNTQAKSNSSNVECFS